MALILVKNKLVKLFEEAMEGSKISTKVNYLEINEKPTIFVI